MQKIVLENTRADQESTWIVSGKFVLNTEKENVQGLHDSYTRITDRDIKRPRMGATSRNVGSNFWKMMNYKCQSSKLYNYVLEHTLWTATLLSFDTHA